MQLTQLGINLASSPTKALIPTDKTKTYSLLATFDENRYYLCSTLHPSPKVRSVVLNTFTDGVNHVFDPAKKASFKKSTDLAATFGAKGLLYNPTSAVTSWKTIVRVATTTNGTLATDFENGDTIDGVVLATGNRILLKNQTTQSENGIYTVNASGAPTRATDADTGAELEGAGVAVQLGTANTNTAWLQTTTGVTVGSSNIVWTPLFQVQSLSAGYSNNGRFHALISCHTSVGTPGGSHELRYVYSDDDCTTMSSAVTVTLPTTTLLAFRMHDKIIDLGNGVMVAPMYYATDEGNATQSERYVVRTTDGGANWTCILVEGPTTAYINEGSILAITNSILIMICRYENLFQYWMYKSTDGGATWTSVGALGTTVGLTVAAPCALRKFKADNGKWYCAMYFPDKATFKLYALYGRLDNGVDGGVGLFNTATLTLLRTDTKILHYGDFVHYNNNMNARGAWPRENGTFPTDNELIYFENLTTQYDTVFALIDPVTIYDKLSNVLFIGSARGLVSNTTNEYGVVNGSDQVTTLKSLAPGPLSQNFTATAGGILLSSGAMAFDGTKALSHGTAAYFKGLHYSSAGVADVQSTLYFVAKFGTISNPNAFYGLFGNNAGSASNRGYSFSYDDRAAVPRSDNATLLITKGTAGFIIDFHNDNMLTPNTFICVCLEVDLSQATDNNKVKLYVNNVLQTTTVTTFNASISSSDPNFVAQIGAIGNNGGIMIGSIKDIIVTVNVDIPSVRTNFITALMAINGL